jgi:CBS domain-containing protein
MKSVKDILSQKGTDVWSVTPDAKVFDALKLMAEKNIGAVLVIDHGDIKGLLSERDYARKVALEGKSSRELLVKDIMSPKVLFVTPDKSSEDCMTLMIEKRIRHLPVLEEDKLKGIVSIGDVVKAVLDHKEHTIDQLEQYITNRR